jgi:electron transfer flavoprotein alpha subunit
LAQQFGQPFQAALIGEGARSLAERLPEYGVSVAHLAQHERLDDYAPEAWAQCVVDLIGALKPTLVLASGSDRGSEVLAHIAAQANLPLAANCIEIQSLEPLTVTRMRWGGSLLEDARLTGDVKLITIAPHCLQAEAAPTSEALSIHTFTPNLSDKHFRVRITQRVEPGAGKISLAEAKVVVGGGRGVGSAEGFKTLEELAGLLGGAVGCSRAVTSLGWRPHMDQVGQTGTRIAPEIYIACGISGAIQHMVGAKGSKRILAINTDPEASIVAQATYAIIGDLHEVVPALSAAIRQARSA